MRNETEDIDDEAGSAYTARSGGRGGGYFGSVVGGSTPRSRGGGIHRSHLTRRRPHAGAETRQELEALPDDVLEAIAREAEALEPPSEGDHEDHDEDEPHETAEAVLDLVRTMPAVVHALHLVD